MVDHGAPREARWCGAPEWIALRLTGRWQTDATLAVRTGAFDVLRGEFSSELLELAGAPSGLFPPVHGSPANLGSILPAIARDLGLPASTQVVIAGHDDIVAAYGAGGARGDLIDSGGTAEGLVRIVDSAPEPSDTVRARMAMTQYYLPGTWALIAGAGSTGALMDRVAHMLGRGLAELDAAGRSAGQVSDRDHRRQAHQGVAARGQVGSACRGIRSVERGARSGLRSRGARPRAGWSGSQDRPRAWC